MICNLGITILFYLLIGNYAFLISTLLATVEVCLIIKAFCSYCKIRIYQDREYRFYRYKDIYLLEPRTTECKIKFKNNSSYFYYGPVKKSIFNRIFDF